MSAVTRFAARDPGPTARVAGFIGHLRDNGLRLGVGETETALQALAQSIPADMATARAALRAVCTGCVADARRFDDLFDAYWRDGGRVRTRSAPASAPSPHVHARALADAPEPADTGGRAQSEAADDSDDAAGSGEGRLMASRATALLRTDLRHIVDTDDIAEAEAIARRIGAALRDRRSRRRRQSRKGATLDFRRVARRALARGGEPFDLPRRTRPDRPVRLTVLCDVSGSMGVHARVYLAFLAGLLRADPTADGCLFHTRLVPISDALRDPDPLRALARLSLLADGFGGGSHIGAMLDRFSRGPARRSVTGRSVVVIISDGYDTGPAEALDTALAAIARRGARLVWLTPLRGWRNHDRIARGMAAASAHCDAVLPAATLDDLAALEPELARL